MKKVLVTGITGMAGSHLADYLLEAFPEVEVHGLVRWRSPRENVKHLEGEVTFVDGDLTDYSSLVRVLGEGYGTGNGYDTIFHLAAQSYVPFSYYAPRMTFENNAMGALTLFEAVRACARRATIHVCSSSEVYGQPDEVPITTDAPLRPVSPYGVSKAAMDMLAFMYWECYEVKTIRTRAFTHTGARRGDVFVASAFAKQIAAVECGRGEVVKVGNLDSVRTWCDVRDMVRAYVYAVQKCEPGSVWNVGGEQTTTVGEMLDLLLGMATCRCAVEVDQKLMRPADVTLQIPDVEPFREVTGWVPEFPLEATLLDLLVYWRRFYEGQ